MRLQDTLTDQGLMTRGTLSRPAQPISTSNLQQLLRNPYYKGVIVWDDEEIPGRHEPIVSPELFDQVQVVADHRSARGQHDRVHQHYLRGHLYCERCHVRGLVSRLLYSKTRGRSSYYDYYFCRGRQLGECDLPHLPVAEVEAAVLSIYSRLQLPEDFASAAA